MSSSFFESSFKMPVWVATLDVPFINNKPRSHKPSFDHRPPPTYEEVMQMTRVQKEVLNTPVSDFAPTGSHIGAIILGPDRWLEIGHWVEFMQIPSEKVDDQVPKPAADESVFENVCLDEIVPEDSCTKWDYDPELDEWEVDYYVKPTPDFNKSTGLPNLVAVNLWRLENRPCYNPAILNRATPHDISLFNYIHVVVVPIGTRHLRALVLDPPNPIPTNPNINPTVTAAATAAAAPEGHTPKTPTTTARPKEAARDSEVKELARDSEVGLRSQAYL